VTRGFPLPHGVALPPLPAVPSAVVSLSASHAPPAFHSLAIEGSSFVARLPNPRGAFVGHDVPVPLDNAAAARVPPLRGGDIQAATQSVKRGKVRRGLQRRSAAALAVGGTAKGAPGSDCEVGVVKWVRCFTMAEVLGRVQQPNVPQAAPRRVVGKPTLGPHPRATVLSARGPRRTSQNGARTSPHKSHPELTPAESAHYETNKSSTHKYKTHNKCIGKYPELSPNAQPGKHRRMDLLSHAQHSPQLHCDGSAVRMGSGPASGLHLDLASRSPLLGPGL